MADVHVRADLVRSGGFAGLTRRSSLDTGTMAAADAQQLRDLVAGLDLGSLGRPTHTAPTQPPVPDGYTYDLSIVRGPDRVRVQLDERSVAAELRPLIQFLDRRAQPG